MHARIQPHYTFLLENLVAKDSGLVGELYAVRVLTKEERDIITSKLTPVAQNEELLDMLSRKTKDHFDKFLDALDRTGQRHVRNRITGQG